MIYLFQVVVLIFSAIIHEYMHGFVAYQLGDDTAQRAGRLTINPLAHLEWFGSFILPLIMLLSGMGFVIGWAKPVPYNPYNLRDKKWGEAKVALAGPLANFVVAILFGLVLRFVPFLGLNFANLIALVIYINLLLMVFNLLPIPPLDGSKILAAFLSPARKIKYYSYGSFGMILVIFIVMLFSGIITGPVNLLFRLITA
ncbi:MAG: site-2 protease family protein [Patescibacteria group bacterium]|jgi:Zn-dependent protease|nr:site-2 protease family protein [Patescibacteria group bacterium]MDD3939327.1 site-2 protease family protein [Patescibacteria group bacterium]MDD4443965.1 site-2 protease family protein [Patescibacteria group bacterium]NCU39503.1 site-2 protease family protein [Candidatus Falkowbacteria bacterium]